MSGSLPLCPHCKSSVILLHRSIPPKIACTGCPYVMTGRTHSDAIANYTRRDGYSDDTYTCTKCRRLTSPEYDHLGKDCLCGGTVIRERTMQAMEQELGRRPCK